MPKKKPKRKWIDTLIINPKTGKIEYKYFTPKTSEEEEKLEAEFEENMQETIEAILSSENDTKENQK
jgi:hypothetical protein